MNNAGRQQNKKLEIQGGLIGTTRRDISMSNVFLVSHVVSEIEKGLREISYLQKKETQLHLALNQNKINIQSNYVMNLVVTFVTVKLQFTDRQDTNLYNTITGRLFKDNVKRDVLSIHIKGIQLYKKFIAERLRKGPKISIWDPLKKAGLKAMKSSKAKVDYVTDSKLH